MPGGQLGQAVGPVQEGPLGLKDTDRLAGLAQLAVDLGDGQTGLVATPGMDFPITGLFDLGVFNAYAGVSPGWYFGGSRDVLHPLAGQLSTYFGAGLDFTEIRVSAGWTRTYTAYGAQDGISVGLGF